MYLYLAHHGAAVGPDVDPRRPLSAQGLASVERTAAEAAVLGARPTAIWHSGKLRARQTADAFLRACNPLAEFSAARDLQPDDPPTWIRDRLRGESHDLLLAGHFSHLPRLLGLLLNDPTVEHTFPLHGIVALRSDDGGETWSEEWRLTAR